MLIGAGLPDKYWSDALVHAIFVKNRLPHEAFNYTSTPYTELTGTRPNLEKLRIFGCPVTVHRPGRRRTKLANQTYDGNFFRYAGTFENCKYVDKNAKKVKITRIKGRGFDEAHFTSKSPPPGGEALIQAGYKTQMRIPVDRLPVTVTEKPIMTFPNKKIRNKSE